MLHDFGLFLGAVWDHAITLAAGCIVTVMLGIIEKRILKRSVSVRTEIGILLAFILFACFQAWRDQFKEALRIPDLQSQVTSRDQTIKELRDRPPQYQVNVPASIINIPAQWAFMTSPSPLLGLVQFEIGKPIEVNDTCKNISPSVPAQRASCIRSLLIVDTKPIGIGNSPFVSIATQDKAYAAFMKDAKLS